jgi:hypothetical protein
VVLVVLRNVFVEGMTGVFYNEDNCVVYSGGHKGQSKVCLDFHIFWWHLFFLIV